jgi:hypothetical protein
MMIRPRSTEVIAAKVVDSASTVSSRPQSVVPRWPLKRSSSLRPFHQLNDTTPRLFSDWRFLIRGRKSHSCDQWLLSVDLPFGLLSLNQQFIESRHVTVVDQGEMLSNLLSAIRIGSKQFDDVKMFLRPTGCEFKFNQRRQQDVPQRRRNSSHGSR